MYPKLHHAHNLKHFVLVLLSVLSSPLRSLNADHDHHSPTPAFSVFKQTGCNRPQLQKHIEVCCAGIPSPITSRPAAQGVMTAVGSTEKGCAQRNVTDGSADVCLRTAQTGRISVGLAAYVTPAQTHIWKSFSIEQRLYLNWFYGQIISAERTHFQL